MCTTKKDKSILKKTGYILIALICLTPWINGPIALILGFLFTLIFQNPLKKQSTLVTKHLLKISVIGLGFGMNLATTFAVGKDGFWITAGSIILVLTAGSLLGKWLQIDKKTTHLISSGTAICGGSAIAAIGPVLKASKEQMSVALGVIFLLNSIALLLFPPLGHLFQLTQHQFGVWAAIAIHDTSSVTGAAAAYGQEALQTAVTIKLTRSLWIIPLSLLTAFWFKNESKKVSIPWFIALYIVAMVLNSYVPIVAQFSPIIVQIARAGLTLTLFLIGAGLSLKTFNTVGWKPLSLALLLWIIISTVSLLFVLFA